MFAFLILMMQISGTMLFLRAIILIDFRSLIVAACFLVTVFAVDTVHVKSGAVPTAGHVHGADS